MLDSVKQEIIDFFIFIWRKFKYIIVGIIVLVCISSIIFFEKYNPTNIETQEIYLFGLTIPNWLAWITIITVPITAVWAIYQYKKSTRIRQQEKGAEIAKLFSDEMVTKCGIIASVIENSELTDLLDIEEKDFKNLERFDIDEIRTLYNDKKIDQKYKRIIKSKELQNVYLYILEKRISQKNLKEISQLDREQLIDKIKSRMKEKYSEAEIEDLENKNLLEDEFKRFYEKNKNSEDESIEQFYKKKYTDEEARKLFILDNKDMPFLYRQLVNDVLNKLEYISMCISSQSAGSEFVHQSLHQMFLRTVKYLAIEIGMINVDYTDKYYTNVIHVYKEWNKIVEKNRKNEEKNKKKAYKYLEPKISKI